MHRALCLLLLVGFLDLSYGQGDNEAPTNSSDKQAQGAEEGPSHPQVIAGNMDFAFSLFHIIASESPEKNIFFSPLSISAALAMLSLGARGQSQTQLLTSLGFNLTELSTRDVHQGFQQLLRVLSLQDDRLEMHLGNALLLSHDLELLPEFLNDTVAFYNPKIFRPNFEDAAGTVQLINDHVKKETRGKIIDLVSELSPDTEMILVNYIYFKGLWEKPFSVSTTRMDDFHVDAVTTVRVPMMRSWWPHWYIHDRYVPCSVLRLDYQGPAAAFFILPDPGKMKQVEQMLTPMMIMKWNRLLQNRKFYRKVELHFPKFSISSSYELDQILPKLGFRNIFSQQANFSGITRQRKLHVSKSFHKATLDVNEAGAEAAAATGFSIAFLSAQHNPPVLRFNRPFFMILFSSRMQTVLFQGKVVKPTTS
ncbi:kallistatin [Dipodomys spectabilis]|uniref:kallistatin n=1 Tax=Dipodomys spectabilis TaxID=105255 RepID=UPI001C546D48|nr:kallistatin [Dipodomys spectabilis]XP_042548613.1 kallistatin [Dipodomys spectabilis]